MTRQRVSSGAPWEATVGYSRAVVVGRQVFVSGTAPVGDDGLTFAPGDAYRQSRRCLEIIEAALVEAGATMADVVRTRMYVVDITDWPDVGRAHGEFFGNIRPASTLVEVSGLIDPQMRVEIEAFAIIGD